MVLLGLRQIYRLLNGRDDEFFERMAEFYIWGDENIGHARSADSRCILPSSQRVLYRLAGVWL